MLSRIQVQILSALLALAVVGGLYWYVQSLRHEVAQSQAEAQEQCSRADQNADAYLALSASVKRQNDSINKGHDALVASGERYKQAKTVAEKVEADANEQMGRIRAQAGAGGDQCAGVFRLIDGVSDE